MNLKEAESSILLNNDGDFNDLRTRYELLLQMIETEKNKREEVAKKAKETRDTLVFSDYARVQKELAEQAAGEAAARERMARFASQTATSMLTSAVMGDNITDSLKRAVIQLMIMVAQAKLYDIFMTSASGGTNKITAGIANFLFGASPTQTSPSANSAANQKITINQNFGGMGVIDHNFAANSIIPAINKAISTGQARIN